MLSEAKNQNNILAEKNGSDSLTAKDSLFIQKNNILIHNIDSLNKTITSCQTQLSKIESHWSMNLTTNLISNFAVITIFVLFVGLFIFKRKKEKKEKSVTAELDISRNEELNTDIVEILQRLENKINQQTVLLASLLTEYKIKGHAETVEREIIQGDESIGKAIVENEPVAHRYLSLENNGYYIEVFESEKVSNFYESKYDEKEKVSEVSISNNITVKSSAAKSRLTPMYDVEGDYGSAVLKKAAKVIWEGDKAKLLERGKIKLIE